MNALRTMNAVRSFSVVAALCLTGAAAYAQIQVAPPNTPSASVATPTPNPELDGASTAPRQGPMADRHDAMRMAAASTASVDYGMRVKSPSGDVLGTVASIVPGHATNEDYVVIATSEGMAAPVPYTTATSMIQQGALVVNESQLQKAPKVQEYQTEDFSSAAWEREADSYWKGKG